MKDYYAILGVNPDAEDVVIKAACFAMAQRYHPDKFSGDPEESNAKMSDINEARSVLCDPEKRKMYDEQRVENLKKVGKVKRTRKSSTSNSVNESQSEEILKHDFITGQNWQGFENCWISDGHIFIFIDSSSSATVTTFDEFERIWQGNCRNNFFEKNIKIFFTGADEVARSWNELVDSFSDLECEVIEYPTSTEKDLGKILDIDQSLPKCFISNEAPITFRGRKIHISIFPTFIVATYGNSTHWARPLKELSITKGPQFELTGKAPKYAKIIGKKWEHENKDGTQDKRFTKSNKATDVYLLESIAFETTKGNFKIRFSKPGLADEFSFAYSRYVAALKKCQSPIRIADSGFSKNFLPARHLQKALKKVVPLILFLLVAVAAYNKITPTFLHNIYGMTITSLQVIGIVIAIIIFLFIRQLVIPLLISAVVLFVIYLGFIIKQAPAESSQPAQATMPTQAQVIVPDARQPIAASTVTDIAPIAQPTIATNSDTAPSSASNGADPYSKNKGVSNQLQGIGEVAKADHPSLTTIDEQYNDRTSKECESGIPGLFCRESMRIKLCDGKWSESPPDGQSICKQQPNRKPAF